MNINSHEYHYDYLYSILVHSGLLVMRDVGRDSSWWFGVPGISRFKREFSKGWSLW